MAVEVSDVIALLDQYLAGSVGGRELVRTIDDWIGDDLLADVSAETWDVLDALHDEAARDVPTARAEGDHTGTYIGEDELRAAVERARAQLVRLSPPLADERLVAARARCHAAAPAPWRASIEGRDHFSGSNVILRGRYPDLEMSGATDADLDFIAHARSDVPALLDEIARLRDLLGKR